MQDYYPVLDRTVLLSYYYRTTIQYFHKVLYSTTTYRVLLYYYTVILYKTMILCTIQYYLSLLQLAEFKRQEIVAFLGLRQSMSESNAKLGVSRPGMRWDAMGCNQVLGGLGLEASSRLFAPPCWSLWIHVRFLQSSLIMNWWSLILHGLFHLLPNTLNSLTSRSAFW